MEKVRLKPKTFIKLQGYWIVMNEKLRKDILTVLRKTQPALRNNNANKIKTLSNMTIHNAGVFQDQDSISISVIIYTISKISNRPRLQNHPDYSKFKEVIIQELSNTQSILQRSDIKNYRRSVKRLFQIVARFEKKFGMYMREAIEQSKIKRGGRIYEHGISVGQASELLGISRWELMSYLGETKLSDVRHKTGISVSDRIENMRRIFSL